MNHLKFISTVIFVKDIRVSKEFYTKLFGQEIQYDFGKNVMFKSGFTIWEVKEGHEIKQSMESGTQNSSSRFELYFETENLEDVILLIEKEKIKKLHEVKEESWGQRTIRIYDPDGHLIEIGESLKTFIGRMRKTMSDEAVSIKTGMSVKDIKDLFSVAGN